MRLLQAIRAREGDVISVTGPPGTGKSAVLFRLADDARERGWTALCASTRPMPLTLTRRAPAHLSAFAASRAGLQDRLHKTGQVLVTGASDDTLGHATGVSLAWVDDHCALADLTVVEADPVALPQTTSLILYIITPALCAADWPPIARELTDLAHEHPSARLVMALNQADLWPDFDLARTCAQQALSQVELVVLTMAKRPKAVREVWGRIGVVVLAAGASTRMGQPKITLPWGQHTILEQVLHTVQATPLRPLVVVTPHDAALSPVLARHQAHHVINPAPVGLAQSLQLGLAAFDDRLSAVLVVLADQPHLPAVTFNLLAQRWRETQALAVAPFYDGQRGNPILLDARLWPRLRALPPTAEPRQALADVTIEPVLMDDPATLLDCDTPADYAALRARFGG